MDIQNLLAESPEFRAVVDSLPEAAVIFNRQGGLVLGNPALYRLLGLDRIDTDREGLWKTLNVRRADGHPLTVEKLASARALKGESVTGQVLIFTDPRGHDHTVEYSAGPIMFDSQIAGAIGIARNLTEREQLKQSLRVSFARTLRAKQQLESFAAALEEEVDNRTEQVRSLSRALSLAEQRERVRFSRILHEDLQQILLAAKMRVDLLAGRELAENSLPEDVQEISRLVQKAVDTSKSLALEMNPPVLESEGLDAGLKWLASHMEQRYGFAIHTDIPHHLELRQKEVGVLVIQIVREVLFSALKDPRPSHLALIAHRLNGDLNVAIEITGDSDFWEIAREVWKSKENWEAIGKRLKLFGGSVELATVSYNTLRAQISLPLAGQLHHGK